MFSRLIHKIVIMIVSTHFAVSSASSTEASEAQASFSRFAQRAEAGERLNVVFFGGSLTWGAQATDPQRTSYRARMGDKLEAAYPKAHFRFWDAAIGGTGSQLGAFRVERDVLSRRPDLVFLDFTVNDGPYSASDPDKLASYEAVVRRIVGAGIPVVQAILAVKKDVMPNAVDRPLDAKHKEIGAAYHLPLGDAVALMRRAVQEGRATPEALWPVVADVTHPGDEGYALYAEAIWKAYEKGVQDQVVCRVPESMLHASTYQTARRVRLSSLSLPVGWAVGGPHRTAAAYDFVMSRWLDDLAIASVPKEGEASPKPLRLSVRATNLLLFGEATPLSGKYQVRIDGGEPKTFDAGASAKQGNIRYVEMIANGLDSDVEHEVEIIPQLEPGQELRIESLCIAGEPATVSVR